ncbi:DUF6777 domain-containing protein [Streptomyces sp. NPDC126933]|uniref:DUF6777 domain-containing protein n=1 Tax=unclassified Streptomyces TaxID=2593676 RepID=UPI0036692A80
MRSPIRRRYIALAALSAGALITAGCGGDGEDVSSAKDLFLQPVAAQGADPFTPSTAAAPPKAVPSARPSTPDGRTGQAGQRAPARTARVLPGSTPGLYGGIRSAPSCDVERQVRLLTEGRTKARAFAQGAGISETSVPDFLRGLTPVVLRADIRVTSHAFRSGSAASLQSVLQTGTAVMVDHYGVPRVRCAGGNPLRPPVVAQGSVTHRGQPWPDYRPDRVVVVNRAPEVVNSLIIADAAGKTWIERSVGTDGGEDRSPEVPPSYDPGADITDPGIVKPAVQALSDGSSTGSGPSSPSGTKTAPGPGPDAGSGAGPEPAPDAPADCPSSTSDSGDGRSGSLSVPPDCPLPADSLFGPDDVSGDVSGDASGEAPGSEPLPAVPDGGEPGDVLLGPDAFQG